MKTKVSIVKGARDPQEGQIREMVAEAIDHIGGLDDIIGKGDRVLIKPNIAYTLKPGESELTDPRVSKVIYDILVERGASPFIAESSASGVDGEEAFQASGYYDLRNQGYEVINLKKKGVSKVISIDNPKAKVVNKVKIFEMAKEADAIINVPVIKTHDHLPATLALKNMKGLMPDSEKKKFHSKYGLSEAIADLNLAVKSQLVIVDGILCREGLGYPWSEEIEMDLILAGKDAVAVDTVVLEIMGINPQEQTHAILAQELGIGTMDMDMIEVVGEQIEHVKTSFKRPAEALQSMLSLHDFNLISDEKTCTGCRGAMYYFLKSTDAQGKLDQLKELTFVLGKHESAPRELSELNKEETILVGVCTEHYKDLGRHVVGCPPLGSDIAAVALQGEVKQPYEK